MEGPDAHSSATIAPLRRPLFLRPDALQRLPEAFGLGGGAQRVPAEEGGQSPELETRSDRKDHPGNQHPDHPQRALQYLNFVIL
jgi:hypothetical protein